MKFRIHKVYLIIRQIICCNKLFAGDFALNVHNICKIVLSAQFHQTFCAKWNTGYSRFYYSRFWLSANNEGKLLFLVYFSLFWTSNLSFCIRGWEFFRNVTPANSKWNNADAWHLTTKSPFQFHQQFWNFFQWAPNLFTICQTHLAHTCWWNWPQVFGRG